MTPINQENNLTPLHPFPKVEVEVEKRKKMTN